MKLRLSILAGTPKEPRSPDGERGYLNVTMIAAVAGCALFWAVIVHLATGWL